MNNIAVIFDKIDNMEKGMEWMAKMHLSLITECCIICNGKPKKSLYTCSEECHKKLLELFIQDFGENKEIIDSETGYTHIVPLRDIFEKGLSYDDLKNYPVVKR